MGEAAATEGVGRGGSKLVALVLLSIGAAFALGWGVIKVVDALEPGDGCGSYGYGGYGCEPPSDFSITVVPSTGLVDRQTVSLTGTGFAPNTFFGAAQCDPTVGPEAGTAACDLSTARTTSTDGNGDVHLDLPVRRIIIVQGHEVDCALSPCTLGAATLSGTTPIEATSVPISFDPSVPPVPRLQVGLTVDDVTVAAVSGTVTCNREAEVFADAFVQQLKGSHEAFAYGFTDESIVCDTTPTEWTARLVDGSGRLTGGPATYEVFASAYDGFESASATVSGEATLSGGGRRAIEPAERPGETVSVEILGATSGADGLAVDLLVTCDRPVPLAYASVVVSQWVGLAQVSGYGSADFGPCDGVMEMSVPITELTGTLAGGPAEVRASVQVVDFDPPEEFFDSASAVAALRLQGTQRPAPPAVEPNPGSRITITGATRSELGGTVTCEEAAEVELWTEVRQAKGRTTNDAFGFDVISCDGTTSFTIPLDGDLSAGSAAAFVYATAYREVGGDFPEYEYLWDDHQAASLRIRG